MVWYWYQDHSKHPYRWVIQLKGVYLKLMSYANRHSYFSLSPFLSRIITHFLIILLLFLQNHHSRCVDNSIQSRYTTQTGVLPFLSSLSSSSLSLLYDTTLLMTANASYQNYGAARRCTEHATICHQTKLILQWSSKQPGRPSYPPRRCLSEYCDHHRYHCRCHRRWRPIQC